MDVHSERDVISEQRVIPSSKVRINITIDCQNALTDLKMKRANYNFVITVKQLN